MRSLLASLFELLPTNRGEAIASIEGLEAECALDAGFEVASSECTEVSLLVVQPDGLEMFRDRYGSRIANQILTSFAGCAELCLDDPFVFFRLGDAEFCCILPGTSAEVAASIGEKIRARFAAMLTLTTSGPIFATASVGVVSSRQLGFDVDRLRQAARQAMTHAVVNGGNRVAAFTEGMQTYGQSAKLGAGAFLPSSLDRAAALR